jgi:hypothetical protein
MSLNIREVSDNLRQRSIQNREHTSNGEEDNGDSKSPTVFVIFQLKISIAKLGPVQRENVPLGFFPL